MAGPRKYIAVAGNIGAGKSTLVDFLRYRFDLTPFYEPNVDNPFLTDFYGDMKRWAFHSQMYFLAHKFRLHQELTDHSGTVVQDRTIYEDAEIFAEPLSLTKDEPQGVSDVPRYVRIDRAYPAATRPDDLPSSRSPHSAQTNSAAGAT